METTFQALWASNPSSNTDDFSQISCEVRATQLDELTKGDVILKGEYSSINYKDALALTGKAKILRQLPLVPGIDIAGEVVESHNPNFNPGDKVLCNGANIGEKYCGGYSEYLRVTGDVLVPCPEHLSTKEAMIFGTAGFTAALAVHQLELNGLRPEKGEVLVTGATGGVGCLALAFLNRKGYETVAWTRRKQHTDWLHACGASRVEDISNKDWSTRPLESVVYSAAIDNIGGEILSHIIPRIDLWGSVASIGLAQSHKLDTTVYPFILRGVNLLGVSSNNCPPQLRKQLWTKIADEMKPKNLDHIANKQVSLSETIDFAQTIIAGQHLGRVLVKI